MLLPIILHKLPTSHLAIWYIFLAISAAISLLDFGFQSNIMRNVSYVMSGAQKLLATGIDSEFKEGKEINWTLFWSLVSTAKRIYSYISIVVFFILIIAGTYYIYTVTKNFQDQSFVLYSWILYLLVSVVNFYFYYYNPLLLGRGLIREYNITIAFSKATNLLLSIAALEIGLGLMGIVIALFISVLVDRFFARRFFNKGIVKEPEKAKLENLFPILWNNSWRIGLVSLGSFLILRANIFLVSSFLPLSVAASYGLSLQLLTTASSFGMIFFTAFIPKINSSRLSQNLLNIRIIVARSLLISWTIFILSTVALLILGNLLLELIKSKTHLISNLDLLFLALILVLEMNHTLFATLITTKNSVPFVKPALISGILIVLFSFISLKYLKLGLPGILVSQFVVQLAYNNWKWPVVGLKDLGIGLFQLISLPFSTKKNI
ncbi:hypothetical protein GCM10007422_35990 [Pedobacter zeae]|nr:hypothetical protein GCM10007422_35990 [Pedobacter zeae]